MATYLLAWNPKRTKWEYLAEDSEETKKGNPVDERWSCGKNKKIKEGDRVFLIRLAKEPKGIIASGVTVTDAYEDLHWEEDKAKAGKTSMYVAVQWDKLLNPDTDIILSREILDDARFSPMHWDTQMSGISIPDRIARELEREWADILRNPSVTLAEELTDTGILNEGAAKRISVNAYERNPKARRVCIKHYGATCMVCGFNFAVTYGAVGEGLIHVHHLKELAEIGREYHVDPIRDLCPICPNCHAIIHRRKPAYSIKEVKAVIQRAKK